MALRTRDKKTDTQGQKRDNLVQNWGNLGEHRDRRGQSGTKQIFVTYCSCFVPACPCFDPDGTCFVPEIPIWSFLAPILSLLVPVHFQLLLELPFLQWLLCRRNTTMKEASWWQHKLSPSKQLSKSWLKNYDSIFLCRFQKLYHLHSNRVSLIIMPMNFPRNLTVRQDFGFNLFLSCSQTFQSS